MTNGDSVDRSEFDLNQQWTSLMRSPHFYIVLSALVLLVLITGATIWLIDVTNALKADVNESRVLLLELDRDLDALSIELLILKGQIASVSVFSSNLQIFFETLLQVEEHDLG